MKAILQLCLNLRNLRNPHSFVKVFKKRRRTGGERTNLPVLKCYAIQSKEGDSTEAYADKYKFKRLEHGSSMDVQQKEHKER